VSRVRGPGAAAPPIAATGARELSCVACRLGGSVVGLRNRATGSPPTGAACSQIVSAVRLEIRRPAQAQERPSARTLQEIIGTKGKRYWHYCLAVTILYVSGSELSRAELEVARNEAGCRGEKRWAIRSGQLSRG